MVRVWRDDEDGAEIEGDATIVEIEPSEAGRGETVYEDEDEFSTGLPRSRQWWTHFD